MAQWRDLYPFASHYFSPRSAQANGSPRLHYVDESPSGSSNSVATAKDFGPIVCVHGNPTWSFTYREIVKHFSSSRRVIAVDNIGCGLSDKPQDYPYSLSTHIDNLKQLIEHLNLTRITLVVHDWGGAIGLGAATEIPERIARLIILNTAAFPPPYIPYRIASCRIPVVGNWAMRQLNLFARAALHMTLNRLPKLEPAVAQGLIAPYDNWNHRVAIARFVQDIPTRPDQPTFQRLQQIEQKLPQFNDRPIRIVWGMKDWCFRPECLRRFQQLLPSAQANELSDVGHYVMEEAAREVIDAIESSDRELS